MAIVVRGVAFSLRTERRRHGAQRQAARPGVRRRERRRAAAVRRLRRRAGPGLELGSRRRDPVSSLPWTGLFAGLVGLLAVALCAHLAATFMTNRLERTGQPRLADGFRRRGLQTGASVLALSLLALLAAAWKAPALWHRLSTPRCRCW